MSYLKKVLIFGILFFGFFTICLVQHPLDAARKQKTGLKNYTFGNRQKLRVGFSRRKIIVQLQPMKGDGMYRFASWTLRDWKNNFKKIKKYNKYRPLQISRFVTFPFNMLNDNIQSIVLQALFSNDSSEAEGWAHRVMFDGETVSLIAGVFAKKTISVNQIIRYNKLKYNGNRLLIGDVIMIPWEWVRAELNLKPVSVRKPLYIKQDDIGTTYAHYRLQKGESVYSSIIVRFTGRTLANDVNQLARKLLVINKIRDERYIGVNTDFKIPLEWISEEYLVQKTLSLKETEPGEKLESIKPRKKGLPIHVILDPGHGGLDPGAVFKLPQYKRYVFEDETVYDISLRVARILRKKNYTVHMTLEDPNQKQPISKLATKKDEDERVLVHPPYRVVKAGIGINMRIYLVNDIYRKLRRKGVPKENILLMSIHGDALHKSIRGSTVYFPDSRLRRAQYKLNSRIYRRRKEYQKKIRFRDRDNRRASLLSSSLGGTIIKTLKNEGLLIHGSSAVRGYYYRKGFRTLPGILRYSQIPTSVLVEVGNLNNKEDRNAFRDPVYRQKIAASLVKSINKHFNNS